MALITCELFSNAMKRTRSEAFENEEETSELQRKWFINERQVLEANPHDREKIYENTVNRLFNGSKSFWMGNNKPSGADSVSPPQSSELSVQSNDKSGSQECPAQRPITSYFEVATKQSPSAPMQTEPSCSMDTDESHSNKSVLFKKTLKVLQFLESGGVGVFPVSPSSTNATCQSKRGSLERQLTIDNKGGLSASFASPSPSKTIHNRCHCNTGMSQLQSCTDCLKNLCEDCLRVCYKCSKLFCRDCRMNSFLHENNKTACYRCLG